MISKKRIQKIAAECITESLNDIDAPESTIMSIGFIVWNSINDAYKLGYKNAKKKFALEKKDVTQ